MIPKTKQPAAAVDEAGRNLQLDGLRAIAVTLVLASHYSLMPVVAEGLWGALGVHAFFVLSGFLITGILLDARPKDAEAGVAPALKAFYLRRSLRIFPLYYAFILFLYVANVDGARNGFLYHLFYLTNVGMAVEGDHYGHNSHLWSLAVEEQFYLLWPWFVLLLPKRRIPLAIAVMAAGAVIYRVAGLLLHFNDYALRMVTPAVLDSLAAGAMLAVWRREGARFDAARATLQRWGLVVAAPAAAVMSILKGLGHLPYAMQISVFTPLVAVASAAIIDRAADGFAGRFGRLLCAPALVYIGQRSYAIYVLHLCVPYFLVGMEQRLGTNVLKIPGLAVAVPALIAIALAEISWHIIEKPCNGLKRYFEYKQTRSAKPAKAPALAA